MELCVVLPPCASTWIFFFFFVCMSLSRYIFVYVAIVCVPAVCLLSVCLSICWCLFAAFLLSVCRLHVVCLLSFRLSICLYIYQTVLQTAKLNATKHCFIYSFHIYIFCTPYSISYISRFIKFCTNSFVKIVTQILFMKSLQKSVS